MTNKTNSSGQSTEGLIEKIESLLHNDRSALSAEAAHLLEEARDELKRAHSASSTEKESAEAEDRAFGLLLRLFAKPKVMDQFEEWMDRMLDAL